MANMIWSWEGGPFRFSFRFVTRGMGGSKGLGDSATIVVFGSNVMGWRGRERVGDSLDCDVHKRPKMLAESHMYS